MAAEHGEKFAVGTLVCVAGGETLEHFLSTWIGDNPLTPDQLEYAGYKTVVREVGFYPSGDALYSLEGIPGTWHEACLRASAIGHAYDDHEGTALWKAIDNELRSLEENRDIEITTARSHVIGALCEQIARLGLVKSRNAHPRTT
jgi:hypothetical protein